MLKMLARYIVCSVSYSLAADRQRRLAQAVRGDLKLCACKLFSNPHRSSVTIILTQSPSQTESCIHAHLVWSVSGPVRIRDVPLARARKIIIWS